MNDALIIQAARFGDLLQTARLIKSIQRAHKAHLAIDTSLIGLAEQVYPEAVAHGVTFHNNGNENILPQLQEEFGKLRQIDYQSIYNCNFSGITSALSRLFASEKVRGYRPGHDSMGGLTRSPWNRMVFRLSSMRQLTSINLVDLWGWLHDQPIEPRMVNPPARGGGGGIGVAVAGRELRRSLPPNIYAPIIATAASVMQATKIKFFGIKRDTRAARDITGLLPPRLAKVVTDLCGRTDLPMLREELRGLDLVLTPDTGIMHLAASMGVPVMGFFLSSAWCHETGPYGQGHMVWQANVKCSPCLENAQCPNNLACLAPFQDKLFLRAIADALTGKKRESGIPALQLWRSDFDNLGLTLDLIAGEDFLAPMRKILRDFIKEYLRLNYNILADTDEKKDMLANLVPDQEWMLPRWRYN